MTNISAMWPGVFASPWMLLVSVVLALLAVVLGIVKSSSQKKWWRQTKDEYHALRTGSFPSTKAKGDALARHVERLYTRMGYHIGTHSAEGEPHLDGQEKGIDVIVECKPANAIATWPYRRHHLPQPFLSRLGIQCKNNASDKADVGAIQEAFAGSPYWDCDLKYATSISPSDFTGPATKFADKIRVNHIGAAAYEQAMDEFQPPGPAWPIGWARALQIAMLSMAFNIAVLSYAALLLGNESLTDVGIYSLAIAVVLLSVRVAYVESRRKIARESSIIPESVALGDQNVIAATS